jgi:thioredoxin 1
LKSLHNVKENRDSAARRCFRLESEMNENYLEVEPARDAIDAMKGPVLLEFGAPWCEHCRAADRYIEAALAAHPKVAHVRVEDGRGKPLGRSFKVKLWPTLVFLRDGQETGRLVRPSDAGEMERAMCAIDPGQA